MPGNDISVDVVKMEHRLHIKNKELRIPDESLRSPSIDAIVRSPLLEDKTSALHKNFSICDQTKLFITNHDSGAIENSPDGSHSVTHKQITGSNVNGRELKEDLTTINNASNLLLSSAKEINSMSCSRMVPSRQKSLKSNRGSALSRGCDPQFNPLYEPTCHFCGLFDSYPSFSEIEHSAGCTESDFPQLEIKLINAPESLRSLRCTQCKQIHYCSVDCQKKDWQTHSLVCKPVKLNTDKIEDKSKSSNEIKKKENAVSMNTNETEGQGKKTMASDLNMLDLKKDMKVEGMVTEFLSPDEFYVQINSPEVRSNLRNLSEKLKDQGGINQDGYVPTKGEVGIAQFSTDQSWYRMLIKEVDIPKKIAHIRYIDFGNEEKVPLNKIKRLPEDIAHFPPCAIKCCLGDVVVKEEWNAICRNTVAPVLIGMCCSLTIVNILMNEIPCFVVDVTLPDSGKHLHEMLLEMEDRLNLKNKNIEMGNSTTGSAMEESNVQEKKLESKDHSSCLTPKAISLSIGDSFLGMVAHIQTPGDFFCQQMDNGRKLSKLQVSLNEYCDKISTIKDFCPAIGDMCGAQFTGDKKWYRASVLSYVSENTVLVGYVDYGNVEALRLSKLRPIVPELMELPVQAIKCTLAGVKPVSGTWSTEATSVMIKLLQNKMVTITVVDKKENAFVVEIADESMTPIINVSSYLLKSGYAVKESSAMIAVETRINTLEEVSGQKLDRVESSWVTLTAKQVVNVSVCVLYSPSEFYCQLLNRHDLIALEELNLSLVEYCQKISPSVSKVTKGELCCAYFSGDGRWYRAVVKDTASVETCKVQFVDYGNYEEVTLNKVRPISAIFMKLPFQAIRCCLSGVRPINNKWTEEATATFQMCTAGKKLQAKVVSLTTNSAEVELTDNTAGSPKMINDILIKSHLALKKEIIPNQKMPSGRLIAHDFQECAEKAMCCCTELKKQVAKLEQIVYLLLKDHFGEDKLTEIVKSLKQ